MEGNWEAAKDILDHHLDLVRFSISKNFETALHVAVSWNKTSFVKKLVDLMGEKDLELRNSSSETALVIAARTGNVDMARIMLEKNSHLLYIPGYEGLMPLHVAVLFRNYHMVCDLYYHSSRMDGDAWTNESRGGVLLACVEAEYFDIALQIVEDHSDQLALNGGNVLRALAQKSLVFTPGNYVLGALDQFHYELTSWIVYVLRDLEKKEKVAPLNLLNLVWKKIMTLPWAEFDDIMRGPADPIQDENTTTSKMRYSSRVLFLATEMGNTGFIMELIHEYPELVREVNDLNQSIFHVAVLHRHVDIYNLLHGIGMGFAKDHMITLEDENGNTMLHLAGILMENAYNKNFQHILGVALQMQQEWLWFKEVEGILPLHFRQKKNKAGLTPREVFTKKHKKLVFDGEKWIKDTASQLMVVAALMKHPISYKA